MDINLLEKINFYHQFKKWYFEILHNFKFDHKKDVQAAEILSELLNKKADSWNLIEVLMNFQNYIRTKKHLLIYGCGPSLEETVYELKNKLGESFFHQVMNLAADGSSRLLKELNIPIDAVFTDLDGITRDEFNLARFVIIHAHGDNIKMILKFQDSILKFKNLIGTVQIEPLGHVINPGGFTDGDRIFFFIRTFLLPHHTIFLIGMDFNDIVGKYSKQYLTKSQKASKMKQEKLKMAFKLLKRFHELTDCEIVFINSKLKSREFKNLSIDDFKRAYSY